LTSLAARLSEFDDTSPASPERGRGDDDDSRESGTRRVARRVTASPEIADLPEETPPSRASQRPTVPVPGTASLVGYLACPPRIQQIAVDAGAEGAKRPVTLRVRLTPFAREHAVADGDTDDTPGALLEYLKVFGSLDRLPVVTATMTQILLTQLDHREGFVLSLIDGRSDIDALLDACPMPTHKVLRILQGLRARGLISLRPAGTVMR
jgi:hypothetical protein